MWDNDIAFSVGQTLADAPSDRVVDAGIDDIGRGEPVVLQVSLSAGASGALEVTLTTADDAVMSSAVDLAVFHVEAGVVARGGTVLAAPLPTGCKRYLRLHYAGASGGRVTAGLVQAAQTT